MVGGGEGGGEVVSSFFFLMICFDSYWYWYGKWMGLVKLKAG